MGDKTQGAIPWESPPLWGFVHAGISGICLQDNFPSSKGMLPVPKEGLSSAKDPLLLAATGIWALGWVNTQLQPLALPGSGDPAERRAGSTKAGLGKGQKERDAESRGKSHREVVVGAVALCWGCCWLGAGMMSPGWCPAPCWALAAAAGEVGLAGAGLTIPLAPLQRRLGNELGLKQHNTFC